MEPVTVNNNNDLLQSPAADGSLERYLSKFEQRPKPVLSHEYGNGAPCNRCDTCTGLDLHFWRKICKTCACRLDEHDVMQDRDHGEMVTGKLFGKWSPSSSASSGTGSSRESLENLLQQRLRIDQGFREKKHHSQMSPPSQRQSNNLSSSASTTASKDAWAWTPTGDWRLAHRYLMSLPEMERPLKDTPGAQLRRQRLAQQLPYHDSDVQSCKSTRASERDQRLHRELIEHIKKQVVGVAEVVDCARLHPQPTRCRGCGGQFKCTDVGVVTDHEQRSNNKDDAIWHPRCFTCCVCKQLLVDLLYFFRDGNYYCGRHYGERVYPRCAGCDELIFALEYTFAEEKAWHLEHFCCFGCDRHLSGQRYIVKEEQPYCVDCYMHKFARICVSCGDKIAPFDQRVSYGDLHWHAHATCFKCTHCRRALCNEKFLLNARQPYCSTQCKAQHHQQNQGF